MSYTLWTFEIYSSNFVESPLPFNNSIFIESSIKNGLEYASNTTMGKYLLPWNDPAKAIKGGAIWIARNYIAVGQDTLYFQKYDVVNNGTELYNHQYMQNI